MNKFNNKKALSRAVDKQLRSFLCPEDGLEKIIRGKTATVQQITGFRQKTENLFISAIPDVWEKEKQKDNSLPVRFVIKKKNHHKHKRGHRSVAAINKKLDLMANRK